MRKTIVTRSCNDKLYILFKAFWNEDNEFVRCTNFNGYKESLDYLLHLFDGSYSGYIVNADEDFFIIDEKILDVVISQMKRLNYAYCGVPDGGVISHRKNSEFNLNPFFTIFNVDLIREKIHEFDASKSKEYGLKSEKKPNLNEPFAGFMYWLNQNFEGAVLTDIETTDNISTVIKINDVPMAIHSWYSREYGKDKQQTSRIDDCMEFAILNRKKCF